MNIYGFDLDRCVGDEGGGGGVQVLVLVFFCGMGLNFRRSAPSRKSCVFFFPSQASMVDWIVPSISVNSLSMTQNVLPFSDGSAHA